MLGLNSGMFFTYSIDVNGVPFYYGKSKSSDRDRIYQHKSRIRSALNGMCRGTHADLYARLADAQIAGKSITFKVYSRHSTEIEALAAETALIEAHTGLHGVDCYNRLRKGCVRREKDYERALATEQPATARESYDLRDRLLRLATNAETNGLPAYAKLMREKAAAVKIGDTAQCCADYAFQRSILKAKKAGLDDLVSALQVSRQAGLSTASQRECAEIGNDVRKAYALLAEAVPEDPKKRVAYVEKLVYNEKRYVALGRLALAEKFSARAYAIKRSAVADGVKALKPNLDLIAKLKADPDLSKLSYAELSKKYGVSWENLARLARLAGIRKENAHHFKRAQRKQALVFDPEVSKLTVNALAAKHALSRMSVIRYLSEVGLTCASSRNAAKKGVELRLRPVLVRPSELFREVGVSAVATGTEGSLAAAQKPVLPKEPAPKPYANKCYQRLIRERILAEDLQVCQKANINCASLRASDFTLGLEKLGVDHRDFIKRYEWLGTVGVGIKWCFAARYGGHLGGVVLLSEPYHPSTETALIARGACASWTPKNLGSRLVMFACRWMSKNTPKRQFVAYADEEANEVGQIYQACNFRFLGYKETAYGLDAEGNRRSLQTFKRTSKMVPWLKKQGIELPSDCFTPRGYLRWSQIPEDIKTRMRGQIQQSKAQLKQVKLRRGKYLLLLGPTPSETRWLNRRCTQAHLPYPRRAPSAFC